MYPLTNDQKHARISQAAERRAHVIRRRHAATQPPHIVEDMASHALLGARERGQYVDLLEVANDPQALARTAARVLSDDMRAYAADWATWGTGLSRSTQARVERVRQAVDEGADERAACRAENVDHDTYLSARRVIDGVSLDAGWDSPEEAMPAKVIESAAPLWSQPTTDELAAAEKLGVEVAGVLPLLTERQRTCVELRFGFHEAPLSNYAIAAELDISEPTVRRNLAAALATLGPALAHVLRDAPGPGSSEGGAVHVTSGRDPGLRTVADPSPALGFLPSC